MQDFKNYHYHKLIKQNNNITDTNSLLNHTNAGLYPYVSANLIFMAK